MPLFQGHHHRAETINTSPHCTQKELATTYIITQDGHGHRAYLYDRNKKQFQPSGFHTNGRCRAAFLDILTSFFYWADRSDIKRACVSGGDVNTVISIRGSTDDISIDSNRALLFFTYDRSGKSKICCIDMNKKTKKALTKRTVGPKIMSLDTEKQVLYWKVLHHNKLYSLVYGDHRGSASTYTLLSNCRRHESYFTYFPDKSIITCCQKAILIMKLKSKNTQRIHFRKHHDCKFVHVTNNQIHVLSHHRLFLYTMTGRPLAVIKYPTKQRYWLIKFY